MVSQTMSDLLSLSSEQDRMKACGFVERSGMVICGEPARPSQVRSRRYRSLAGAVTGCRSAPVGR